MRGGRDNETNDDQTKTNQSFQQQTEEQRASFFFNAVWTGKTFLLYYNGGCVGKGFEIALLIYRSAAGKFFSLGKLNFLPIPPVLYLKVI